MPSPLCGFLPTGQTAVTLSAVLRFLLVSDDDLFSLGGGSISVGVDFKGDGEIALDDVDGGKGGFTTDAEVVSRGVGVEAIDDAVVTIGVVFDVTVDEDEDEDDVIASHATGIAGIDFGNS